jgi:hypothetical protein
MNSATVAAVSYKELPDFSKSDGITLRRIDATSFE